MASLYHRSSEKKRIAHDFRRQEEEVIGSLCRLGSRPISPKTQLEQEKRIRREIANSNERRRMQSINAGFQSLRTLLPQHEGEKLSKAAILQHTAEYIYQLEQEKTRLLSQTCQLKRLVNLQINHDSDGSCSDSPLPKRKKTETIESSDEGIGNMSPSQSEPGVDDVRREMIELRVQLDRERRLRLVLEEQIRNMEAQLYPERIREIAHQVQLHYQSGSGDETFKPLSGSLNMALDAEMTSPPSQLSSEEIESSHEIIGTQPSPEHNIEIPEDLSGKPLSKSSPQHQLSLNEPESENVTVKKEVLCDIPVTLDLPIPPISIDTPVVSSPAPLTPPLDTIVSVVETPTSLQQQLYSSTSRQNLETIVEAIRHLEGDHLFQDDPDPCRQSIELKPLSPTSFQEKSHFSLPLTTESKIPSFSCVSGEFAFHHQIIQSAPISQLRPGVIVSNHS